jgi:hypothetical protein
MEASINFKEGTATTLAETFSNPVAVYDQDDYTM